MTKATKALKSRSDESGSSDPLRCHKEANPLACSDEDLNIENLIEANGPWLQSKPRSSTEIVLKLFPNSIHRMKDLQFATYLIGDYMWDAGYTPNNKTSNNPSWQWLEGKPQPA